MIELAELEPSTAYGGDRNIHAFDFPDEASDFFMAAIFSRETAGQYRHCQGIGDLIFRHSVINADANTTD